jgi:hypothetical protein
MSSSAAGVRRTRGRCGDGRVWKIKRGVDFEVAASSMQAQLHVRAKTRGMRVSTSASGPVGAEDTVVFQFTPILAGVECG